MQVQVNRDRVENNENSMIIAMANTLIENQNIKNDIIEKLT